MVAVSNGSIPPARFSCCKNALLGDFAEIEYKGTPASFTPHTNDEALVQWLPNVARCEDAIFEGNVSSQTKWQSPYILITPRFPNVFSFHNQSRKNPNRERVMPSTSASASTSPRILTPSQAAVVALTTATSSPASPSPKARSRNGSFVPLQRLECVRVAKKLRRNGHRVYVVDVFLQRTEARRRMSEDVYKVSPACKLSPQAMRALMMAEREPDYVVEHRFSDFRQLRDSVTALVRANATHVKTCGDCQDLLRVVLSPQHQNWTVKRVFGNKERRFALLTTYVNDLLALTARAGERTTSASSTEDMAAVDNDCNVRERVAELLQEFLKRTYQPSLGII